MTQTDSNQKLDTIVLSIIILIGFILFACCFFPETFVKHQISFGIGDKSFSFEIKERWEIWEVAALIWSFFFAGYYVYQYESTGKGGFDKTFFIVFVAICFLQPLVAIIILLGTFGHHPLWHITLAVFLSVVYLLLDGLLARIHPKNSIERKNYRESFLLADVPTVSTNLVLFFWLKQNTGHSGWEIFACGGIAFQLVTCNCIFIFTQFNYLREKIKSSVDKFSSEKSTNNKRHGKHGLR